MKRIVIFDVHGTLAQSRQPLDREMVWLLTDLLRVLPIAITSGSTFEQIAKEVLQPIREAQGLFRRLQLFPSEGTEYYRWVDGQWNCVFQKSLNNTEKKSIEDAMILAQKELRDRFPITTTYGRCIVPRGAQISLACIGEDAPLTAKVEWDPNRLKRSIVREKLLELLPEYEITIDGHTSVTVSAEGMGKSSCIKELCRRFSYRVSDMLYVANDFRPYSDDMPVKKMGVDCIAVDAPEQTKGVIKTLLVMLGAER